MLRYHYEVTRFDPDLPFGVEDWNGPDQIGQEFEGRVLTAEEFDATVNKYLYAVEAFAGASGVTELTVGPINPLATPDDVWAGIRGGETVSLDHALRLIGSMLHSRTLGATLESPGRFYVHVGDYLYMWIGSHTDCSGLIPDLARIGIFVVADQPSPMLPDSDS